MFWGKITQKSKPEKFINSRKTISNVHAYFLCQNDDIFIKVFGPLSSLCERMGSSCILLVCTKSITQ